MPRLLPGQDSKIDEINALVRDAQGDSKVRSGEAFDRLLSIFHPMIISECNLWSRYFRDEYHDLKPMDELISDAQYWFMKYTLEKYKPDGPATYNKFIKDHIHSRIRYIYECELRYHKYNIFPDPDKHDDEDDDMFESVAFKYVSDHGDSIEDDILNDDENKERAKLAHEIMSLLNNRSVFNGREQLIFTEIVCNGVTHDKMGDRLGISRTRVTQILRKIKAKLYKQMENNQAIWKFIEDMDIIFDERSD